VNARRPIGKLLLPMTRSAGWVCGIRTVAAGPTCRPPSDPPPDPPAVVLVGGAELPGEIPLLAPHDAEVEEEEEDDGGHHVPHRAQRGRETAPMEEAGTCSRTLSSRNQTRR